MGLPLQLNFAEITLTGTPKGVPHERLMQSLTNQAVNQSESLQVILS